MKRRMSQKSTLEGPSLAFVDDAACQLAPELHAAIAPMSSASTGRHEAAAVRLPQINSGTRARLSVLREANWLTFDRVTAFTRMLLLLLIGCIAISPWAVPEMRIGHDFAAFWTAARLALDGHPSGAYGEPARAAVAALLGEDNYAPFFYPPTALLIWLPFALAPFAAAGWLWIAASGAAYATAVRAVLKGGSVIPALAFPAAWVCALFGQNSLFSAALLGGSAATLDRYPVIAGALLGCFSYKPQIALLAPLVLILTRRWRALAAAATTALVLILATTALFGIGTWTGFIAVLPQASAWNIGGTPGFEKFASPYAAIRLLGGPSNLAWFVQAAAAAAAITILVLMLRKRPGGRAEIALMVAAAALCTPSLGNYELVILAIPGAWLISQAFADGWLPYERAAVATLYLTPFFMVPAGANGVPLGPIAVVALIMLVARRIRHLPQT
jgi:hypothetical protein